MIKRAFDPVVDAHTRLLILGSLPGEASIAAGQYYAHPRNAFWRLMDGVVGHDISTLPYDNRLVTLKAVGIGLWDVIASAERSGSLDSTIRSHEAADLRRLADDLPALSAVAFNGAKAAKIGSAILQPYGDRLTLIKLPSSSPAHARPLAEKAEGWSTLRRFVVHGTGPLRSNVALES